MATVGKKIADFFNPNSNTDNDEGLRSLFVNELRGIYYVEKTLVDKIPALADAATTDQVRDALHEYLAETRGHVIQLEQVFQSIGVEVAEMTNHAISGLFHDANTVISHTQNGSLTRDAGLIIAIQKIEHYEISTYGSLHAVATLLGYTEAAQLIDQTLDEEKNGDHKLTQIAEAFVNERSKAEGDEHSQYRSPHRFRHINDVTAGGTLGI